MDKNEKLERAKALLTAFEEAMPHHDAICDTTGDWVAGVDPPPPLLRFSDSWHKAVDPEKLEQFKGLVHFLKEALFGVDCDNDSAVKISVIDRARDQRRGYGSRIPRISDNPTFKEIWGVMRRARTNAAIAQGLVVDIEREFEFFMEDNKEIFEQKINLG